MSKIRYFILMSILWSSFLIGELPFDSCLSCTGGWRNDELKNHIYGYVFQGIPVFDNRAKAKHMNIWQIGFEGRLASPYDECSYWWLQQYYMRGSAFWGWGSTGSYHEKFTLFLPHRKPCHVEGSVSKAHTQDYNIGLGWLYPLACGFGAGPVGGYSYNILNYSIHNIHSERDHEEHILNNASAKSAFQGPWFGLDAAYVWRDLTFYTGYEFHWVSRWNGSFKLHGKDHIYRYSDKRTTHRGEGSVFYADFRWTICQWLESGFGFKYSYFDARNGKAKPLHGNFVRNGLPCRFSKVKTTKWISYAVTWDAALVF